MASGIWHLACQTYALNLIDSHSGQKQAPQLFLSSKSFRVAKSTPSLATSSAKLSPISKWLSKPSLLSKSVLVFAPLLLLSYTQDTKALTAYTSRAIEGSAPYLTFDGGVTKLTSTDSLLFITLSDGTRYTKSTNPSTPSNPIRLPNAGASFNDIEMIVPRSQSLITMNDLVVAQGNWGDDDGDGEGTGGVTASGSISLAIKDKDGTTVNRGDILDICKAPYKVTLTSTSGSLTTQYGVPSSGSFSGDSVDYYINPNSSPSIICSVRPNLYNGTGYYAGPANIWNPAKGFLVQSTNPSSYSRNFPTTGADGLYFDLLIGGVDESQLNWTVNTSGRIGATVSWTRPRTDSHQSPIYGSIPNDAWITDKTKNVTRVTLHGPEARSQWSNSNPSSITVPSLPQTFELVGRDRSGNEVRYGFVLKQWFVNRGDQRASLSNQTIWCNSLGYRLSRLSDLTNAKCGVTNSRFPCVNGIDGATPRSSDDHYMRHIGSGFFTEWGNMHYDADGGFIGYNYWAGDATGSDQFAVFSHSGSVNSNSVSYDRNGLCTTP